MFARCRSAPAHTKKRKSDQMLEKYEKTPRKLKQEQEKEVIHLLPIKDKSGLIPQTMEKPGLRRESVPPHSVWLHDGMRLRFILRFYFWVVLFFFIVYSGTESRRGGGGGGSER